MPGHEFVEPGLRLESPPGVAGVKERFRWRLNRLRCMTPAEVSHRLLRALSMQAERAGLLGSEVVPPPDLEPTPHAWVRAPEGVDAARYLAAAERIAAGRLDVFALRDVDPGSPPRWNRDPKTGVEAPLGFGKLLNYRNPRLVGDVKYLRVIREHLESWFAACPCRMGPNWSSALEAAIRLINWSVTWQLLGGVRSRLFEDAEGARFRQRWLESIYQHAQFVRGSFSLHSSANNHLIGEAAGLFIAALTWPHWPGVHAWRVAARAILEREALLQNAPDGVNREQAVSYQQFVLDFLLLSLLAGKGNGQSFSVAYESRIEAMLEYLGSIMDAGGNVPMFGDSDDGLVVRLAQGADFSPYRSLLATGAVLFQRDDFRLKAGALDDKTRWLLGSQADARFQEKSAAQTWLPPRQAFPAGGYYILGCDFESDREIRLIADAGPVGYRSIAAHGHADALAFTLSVGGLEFLIDPGTYAYHTQGPWRRYFRGTSAHNTLRVDGRDQSQSGGNFMWLRKARAGCSLWSSTGERDLFEGWQDGYTQLADPVMHKRRIALGKAARRVVIEDTLQMAGEHDIELFFHCSERCRIDSLPDGYAVRQEAGMLVIRLPHLEGGSSCVHHGSGVPISGWVSRRFDDKQPSPTIAWRARLKGEVVLCTEIIC